MAKDDLRQDWLKYQRGDAGYEDPGKAGAVREAFSMDQDYWDQRYDWSGIEDTGALRRAQADGLVAAGMVRAQDKDAAIQRLERNAGNWLYRKGQGVWDPNAQDDSYNVNDPNIHPQQRIDERTASDIGHNKPSQTQLGVNEWMSVAPQIVPEQVPGGPTRPPGQSPPPSAWQPSDRPAPYRPSFAPTQQGGTNYIDQILASLTGGRRR